MNESNNEQKAVTALTDGQGESREESELDVLLEQLVRHLPPEQSSALPRLIGELIDRAPSGLRPKKQPVTILMADLRGFSTLAATSEPEALVTLLQPFFTEMTKTIHQHGGYIDKFLGDGIMALFGAPYDTKEHEQRAISCAARMQQAMMQVNRTNFKGAAPLYVGIGLSTGSVMAGSFGSDAYSEYTVIGDAVNIAARLEKFALRGEVLLSDSCYQAAKAHVDIDVQRELRVRGQQAPITVHKLRAVAWPERIVVPEVEMRSSPRVAVDLPLLYHSVENQRVLPQTYEGSIINLGYGGMLAKLSTSLPEQSEIMFGITTAPTAVRQEDVYARVLHHQKTHDGYRTALAFTSVSERGREAVHRCVDQALFSR